MNEEEETHELTYELIQRAVHGEKEALQEVLCIYEPYHNALVAAETTDADGKQRCELNEDWKVQVQMHLMKAIQEKWRELI
jgi:hypothetical protein